ncbi:nuclear transport factor 2 family protein [Shimazuella kribbensis]|uniref:nuclear transport factor 2 family protein n=1 Tax=Shimazuella kribbensis TaxID=139808 RepID=UPI0004181E59|nr:nuclear transport factor 2 family protein [Shimazuella kribbensis]
MDNSKERNLVQQYVDAYNAFDIDGMVALLHHDVEFRNISNGEVEVETKGKEDFRQLAEESKNIFSERCQTIKHFNFIEDRVEIEIDYEAILAVYLPIGLNAGEKLQLQGKSVFQIKGDKFVLIEDYS